MGLRFAPATSAALAALVWGGTVWLVWPSERLRAAVLVAAVAWSFMYLTQLVKGRRQ
jgi:hypothetical protein